VTQHVVSRDIPPKTAALGEADRQQPLSMNDLRVLAQAVGHVVTEPVQDFSGLEILLRSSNHIDAGSTQRSDCRIAQDGRTGHRERYFEMAEVIRPIEAIAGSRSQFVER